MSQFTFSFAFKEDDNSRIRGRLILDDPISYARRGVNLGFYRPARITLEDSDLEIVLYHNDATAKFIYVRDTGVDPNLLNLIGLSPDEIGRLRKLNLPGQLCLGSERSNLIGRAIREIFCSPALADTITSRQQQNLAVFPIAREGLKYGVSEALYEDYGYYCDEIILDAHHVFDSSVPVYNRKVEMTLFKDKDLDSEQHKNIKVAFIADSIASGLVMKEVIERIKERFDSLEQVEVIAPLATVRGLCRIARGQTGNNIRIRVHTFETLLYALPPDYYYSAHFDTPELHIRPDLEREYREWWGQDNKGDSIADTACAGYGWSEVFFSPRKQIEMINGQLGDRHEMTIAEIVRRNIQANH
jgi:hypothetical protein